MKEKIVVAMSGGVDSSVAALLLAQQGHDLVGISMQVWDYRNNGGARSRATCCAPDDFTDARKVATTLKIPYYVFDFEKTFRREVIDRFVQSYAAGITPNPCVECNNKVKFRELRDRAQALGYDGVATGHYARMEVDGEGAHLLRGVDLQKDQSYFLYGIKPEELAQTRFPVGGFTKDYVRELAREAGLVTAAKPESQDICFVSGTVDEFLVGIGHRPRSGAIVTTEGAQIGEHQGIHKYTVGQRKGLGIGGTPSGLYVVEINEAQNQVVVGQRAELERDQFIVNELSWVSPSVVRVSPQAGTQFECIAQLRHRHPGVPVRVSFEHDGHARVAFLSQWATVTPGQACVFYDRERNTEVLGGGKILKTPVPSRE